MCVEHEHKVAETYLDSGLPRVRVSCTVNGESVSRWIDPTMSLLHFLRHELNLLGTKEGCGEGECGACTIILGGKAVNSCLVLAQEAAGSRILTVEGLGQGGRLSVLQEEFIKEDALQCGFCTPGMLMSARALLDRNPEPEEEDIKEAIAGNLCRCTGYYPIIKAIRTASEREREASQR
ncbi:nicotinate dehydrogenase small FeS subunit [Peptococcaceae bacterium CEB3]|nr:nicotinate dehydrogenase small FeS subunit [Peptococcaceae bacterium CEB3]